MPSRARSTLVVSRRSWLMSAALRYATATFCIAVAVACWILLYDNHTNAGTAVLGGYRDRWFVVCLVVSWVSIWMIVGALGRPTRTTWFGIITIHLAAAVPLVTMEIAALSGLVDFREVLLRGRSYNEAAAPLDPRLRRAMMPDQTMSGYVVGDLTPILGAPALQHPFVFATDAWGLRNSRRKDDPRIVCLGDSILVAGLVPVEEILTERLERALGVEVLNVSQSGDSPQEELIRFETTGLDPRGRIVVQFIFEGNDLEDSRVWRLWRERNGGSRYPESGLLKTLLRILHAPRRSAGMRRRGTFALSNGGNETVYFLYDARRTNTNLGEFEYLARGLAEGHRKLRELGADTALVFVPTKLAVLGDLVTWPAGSDLDDRALRNSEFRRTLGEFAGREGIPFFDLTEPLRVAATSGVLPYFADDTHLNPGGHAAAAQALVLWLRGTIASQHLAEP